MSISSKRTPGVNIQVPLRSSASANKDKASALDTRFVCEPGAAAEVNGDVGRGAKFYSDNCARCHNARPGKEHRPRDWSIIIVHMRVVAGLPGAQARDIEAFLRASSTPPRPIGLEPSATVLSGAQLIEAYGCRGCHLIGGTGGTIGPSLDTVFERRDEAWVLKQIENPRANKPDTVMPPFGLSPEQIASIVEFLRSGP